MICLRLIHGPRLLIRFSIPFCNKLCNIKCYDIAGNNEELHNTQSNVKRLLTLKGIQALCIQYYTGMVDAYMKRVIYIHSLLNNFMKYYGTLLSFLCEFKQSTNIIMKISSQLFPVFSNLRFHLKVFF